MTYKDDEGQSSAQQIKQVKVSPDLVPMEMESTQDISIIDIAKAIWSCKLIIVITVFAFASLSTLYALFLPNIYRAEVLLSPNAADQQNSLGALASQFGGLASFAGINLGSAQSDKTTLALEVLISRKFLGNFINEYDLKAPLIAAERWSWQSNKVSYDETIYLESEDKWVREVKAPKQIVPSDQEAYKFFRDILYIEHDKDSGLVTVSLEHLSPYLAKQWVDWLIRDLNATMRKRDSEEALRSIEFLNAQIDKTNVAGLKTVFFELIEEQTKTLMLANVNDEYLFSTIDPAIVAEQKVKPRRALIVILGSLFGGLLGLCYSIIRFLGIRSKNG